MGKRERAKRKRASIEQGKHGMQATRLTSHPGPVAKGCAFPAGIGWDRLLHETLRQGDGGRRAKVVLLSFQTLNGWVEAGRVVSQSYRPSHDACHVGATCGVVEYHARLRSIGKLSA